MLSGVVTSVVGMRRACFARSAGVVSPVRRPMVHSRPTPFAARSSDFTVSPASARMGVSQSTRRGGAPVSPAASDSATGPRKAASVLPEPVAECTSPDSPAR